MAQALETNIACQGQTEPAGGGEGGATSFTELTDAPEAIAPNGVVYGNDAGDGLLMSDIISINENGVFQIIENGDSGIAVTASGAGGFSVAAVGGGGASVTADGDGGLVLRADGAGGAQLSGNGDGGVLVSGNGVGGAKVRSHGEDANVSIYFVGEGEDPIGINLSLTGAGSPRLRVNGAVAVATQEVLVAGVGTLVFTHGILTGFTPV